MSFTLSKKDLSVALGLGVKFSEYLNVLNILVDKGNTVLIIEHNLEVIKQVDYIFDIGPEGGRYGGELICEGNPKEIINHPTSHTAKFLKKELEII